ncbi:hypothetical protein [Pseudomaricurvus sp.]|uniref:hypothetical protein n=1 Tax=Pseudomaricurvus sp. TaxID=2004510 RepID=UPI003F6D7099
MNASLLFQSRKKLAIIVSLLILAILAYGTWSNPNFWFSADQRGDHLMSEKHYQDAAKTYTDSWRKGVAQYRYGDFEDAAHTFARVPGATGAFNQGNSWLMHGKYDDAIKSYDRALGFKPHWKEAEDNKALAIARKKLIDDAGENRDQESADAYDPDETIADQKGDDKERKPKDLSAQDLSNSDLRASWLRRVQTTPADFLRAKVAWQAAHTEQDNQTPQDEDETP